MGLFIVIFILLVLSRIRSWRVYNLSLLYCIPLILTGMGLIKWCGSLQRMDLLMLNSYHRALTTRGSPCLPLEKYLEVKVPSGVTYFTWTGYGKDSHFG